MSEQRLFTVEEANKTVPRLRKLLKRLTRHRSRLVELNPEIQKARDNSDLNGGSIHGSEYLTELVLFSECAQMIDSLGVIIKDADVGLCDFPHMRDGKVVYLCWKLGEDEIAWLARDRKWFLGQASSLRMW